MFKGLLYHRNWLQILRPLFLFYIVFINLLYIHVRQILRQQYDHNQVVDLANAALKILKKLILRNFGGIMDSSHPHQAEGVNTNFFRMMSI